MQVGKHACDLKASAVTSFKLYYVASHSNKYTILEKAQLMSSLHESLTHVHHVLLLITTPYKGSASKQLINTLLLGIISERCNRPFSKIPLYPNSLKPNVLSLPSSSRPGGHG